MWHWIMWYTKKSAKRYKMIILLMIQHAHARSATSTLTAFRKGCRLFSSPQQYSLAFARNFLPCSFANAITKYSNTDEAIDFMRTKEQKAEYLRALQRWVPTLCLPALEEHPDCVFVEDTVVAIGGRAVITNPGHPSRRSWVSKFLICERWNWLSVMEEMYYIHGAISLQVCQSEQMLGWFKSWLIASRA
jgi:hypothetical protein